MSSIRKDGKWRICICLLPMALNEIPKNMWHQWPWNRSKFHSFVYEIILFSVKTLWINYALKWLEKVVLNKYTVIFNDLALFSEIQSAIQFPSYYQRIYEYLCSLLRIHRFRRKSSKCWCLRTHFLLVNFGGQLWFICTRLLSTSWEDVISS